MPSWMQLLRRGSGALLIAASLTAAFVAWRWQYRSPLEELPWPIAESRPDAEAKVSATWLGVTTLLFDDGETQILIDGYITRASVLEIATFRPLVSDVATINYVMDEYRINRLAAIVPVHAHMDHAMDAGRIANRSTALLIGSESVANIARGADVPINQFQTLASGESRVFGEFTITLVESRHVPVGPATGGIPGGSIESPLAQPASFWAYKQGTVHSVLVSHPAGTALIQGSAGFRAGALNRHPADVVFLSVAGLAANGRSYTADYWRETVSATGARDVYAVHFDDFTLPFGQIELPPDIADRVLLSAGWIDELAAAEGVRVRRPPFGIPIDLY